jgi:hypothetical protein
LSHRQKRRGLPKSWYIRLKPGGLPAEMTTKSIPVTEIFLIVNNVFNFSKEANIMISGI